MKGSYSTVWLHTATASLARSSHTSRGRCLSCAVVCSDSWMNIRSGRGVESLFLSAPLPALGPSNVVRANSCSRSCPSICFHVSAHFGNARERLYVRTHGQSNVVPCGQPNAVPCSRMLEKCGKEGRTSAQTDIWALQGYLDHKKTPTPQVHHRALSIFLLLGHR